MFLNMDGRFLLSMLKILGGGCSPLPPLPRTLQFIAMHHLGEGGTGSLSAFGFMLYRSDETSIASSYC